jgi:predicted transcriptional regulator
MYWIHPSMMQRPSRLGGPIPKFNEYHLWKALNKLNESEPIGRKKLSSTLNIGEGSTRTILAILQEKELITIGKSGILLTQKGADYKKGVRMDIADISISDLTIGDLDCAVRVPRMARNVKYGCEERDAAIKCGATGATTLIYTGGKLVFPGSDYEVEADVEARIRSAFSLKNDDVIIIGTGPTKQSAEMGAVVAGLAILGGMQIERDLEDIMSARSTGNELLSLAFAIHDLVGGLPVCAKSRDNLGIRIENGAVVDNAYTGQVLEEVINAGTTIRRIATSGPYKGIRVIVTPIELDSRVIAAIGVVDIRTMAGINNLIRLNSDEND